MDPGYQAAEDLSRKADLRTCFGVPCLSTGTTTTVRMAEVCRRLKM